MLLAKRILVLRLAFTVAVVVVSFPVTSAAVLASECSPSCSAEVCGSDGCGGQCGACPTNFGCVAGACVFQGGCELSSTPGCGGCGCESCVCQGDPFCCSASWDAMCVARCNVACGGCGTVPVCGDGACNSGELCSTCSLDCGECPASCGDVSTKGCCIGQVLFACEAGTLKIENCDSSSGQSCGWSLSQKRYMCGQQGFDPSLTWPRECPAVVEPDVVGDAPASNCQVVPFAGCCLGNSLWWCDWNGLHEIDCLENPPPYQGCGWNAQKGYYDCGGEGMDPSGTFGEFCPNIDTDLQEETTEAPKCKVGELVSTDCADVPYRGCCSDSGVLYFCQEGKALCRLQCPSLPVPSNTCGWHIAGGGGYYDCGGAGSDPAGVFLKGCPDLPLPPDTTSDTDELSSACSALPTGGCCDGSKLYWCELGLPRTFDCLQLGTDPVFGQYVNCGTNPSSGQADCLTTADPSPPDCQSIVSPDPQPDTTIGDSIPVPDAEPLHDTSKPDGTPDLLVADPPPAETTPSEVASTETTQSDGKSDNGLVIPSDGLGEDTVGPGPKKKDGGCAATPNSVGPFPLTLLLALFGLCLLRRSRR